MVEDSNEQKKVRLMSDVNDHFNQAIECFEKQAWHYVVFYCQKSVYHMLEAVMLAQGKSFVFSDKAFLMAGKKLGAPKRFYSFLREMSPSHVLHRYAELASDEEILNGTIESDCIKQTRSLMLWAKKELSIDTKTSTTARRPKTRRKTGSSTSSKKK